MWMGANLLPVQSLHEAARLLLTVGAQRILVVEARICAQAKPDPLWLTAACAEPWEQGEIPQAVRLAVQMPPHIGTLSFSEITTCMEMGRQAAERELDRLLECMGIACCRVLPFKRL